MIVRNETRLDDQPLIQLQHVSKRFIKRKQAQRSLQDAFIHLVDRNRQTGQEFWPVRDVSLEIHAGDSLGIIGPNGSGKSTLLKLISGVLEPTSGDLSIRGRLSSLLELGAGFHGDLTGRENIYLNGSIFGMTRRQMRSRVESIIEFAELGDFIDIPVKHYSSGMYVRLGFAVAIHTDPDLLLIDEVLAVGDTTFQHKCLNAIQDFRERGGTLVLVSHDLHSVQTMCRQVVWIDGGQVQAHGPSTDVVMAYLQATARREEAAARKGAPAALPQERRHGTGKIELTRVTLCDDEGNLCSVFTEGCPLEVHLRYRTAGRIERPVFGVGIHNQNGTHITGPNTRFARFEIPFVEGEGEVVYRIPSLNLLDGFYAVSVAATNYEDTEVFDYHDRAYNFRVYPGDSGEHYGVVTLRGVWRLEPVISGAAPAAPSGRDNGAASNLKAHRG